MRIESEYFISTQISKLKGQYIHRMVAGSHYKAFFIWEILSNLTDQFNKGGGFPSTWRTKYDVIFGWKGIFNSFLLLFIEFLTL